MEAFRDPELELAGIVGEAGVIRGLGDIGTIGDGRREPCFFRVRRVRNGFCQSLRAGQAAGEIRFEIMIAFR